MSPPKRRPEEAREHAIATPPDSPLDTAPVTHPHGHSAAARALSPRAVRFGVAVLAVAAAITAVAMVLLWPDGSGRPERGPRAEPQRGGVVQKVLIVPCDAASDPGGHPAEGPRPGPCGTATVRVSDGPDAGREVVTPVPAGPGAPRVRPGDRVTLMHTPDSVSGVDYQIADHQRGTQMWMLAAGLVIVVIAFGRWRGVSALVGLAVTFAIVLLFVVPAIIDGRSPLLVAIVGAAAIMLSVLYLTHGFTTSTSVAVLGTLASLTLTGVLAAASTAAVHLTGFGSEEATFLSVTFRNVNMAGLLLAGIVIGSLGVLDDVAVTQAVTVAELAAANPNLSARQLYAAGSRVGRAHITSVINTIILAYAGASLPLLILLSAGDQPLSEVLTTQVMAEEIVRSVVGTIGLVAAVPITTSLATLVARRLPDQKHGRAGKDNRDSKVSKDRERRPRSGGRAPVPSRAAGWLDDDGELDGWPGPAPKR